MFDIINRRLNKTKIIDDCTTSNMHKKTKKLLIYTHLHPILTSGLITVSILSLVILPAAKVSQNGNLADKYQVSSTKTKPNNILTTPQKILPKRANITKADNITTLPAIVSTQPSVTKPLPVVAPAPDSSVSGLIPTSNTTPPASGSSTAAVGSSIGSSTSGSNPQTSSYSSLNWSGYLASSGSFSGVSGSWTVPSVTGNSVSISADSTWIGIGGVTGGDLIQTGTENLVSKSGVVQTAAFYELLPGAAIPINSMSVTAGDSMTANISKNSDGTWNILITDNTSTQSYSIKVNYTSSMTTAEWIQEDPSYSINNLIPLDKFNSVTFTKTSFVSNGSSSNVSTSNVQSISLVNNSSKVLAQPLAIVNSGFSIIQKN